MADIKTHLRELSVATTIGMIRDGKDLSVSELYNGNSFMNHASSCISNDISSANNIRHLGSFSSELKKIIDNGIRLGRAIYQSNYFKINSNSTIRWVGNDTQKGDNADIVIDNYQFSLKENSFILKNMGLYALLNSLTGSNYNRGLHVFKTFAPSEYENWFNFTWKNFCNYLAKNDNWELYSDGNVSMAKIKNNNVVLSFNNDTKEIPITISSINDYMNYTDSVIREKVFAKWISHKLKSSITYNNLKKQCSEVAGKKVSNLINSNFKPNNVYDFFQIYNSEYYYAKTTTSGISILRVPSRNDFAKDISFLGATYSAPVSQLNIMSTFKNIKTNKEITFRNECRFSHGQFNGTPEAKMYITNDSDLTDIYETIDQSLPKYFFHLSESDIAILYPNTHGTAFPIIL